MWGEELSDKVAGSFPERAQDERPGITLPWTPFGAQVGATRPVAGLGSPLYDSDECDCEECLR